MDNQITIDINKASHNFLLTGDISLIISNKRLLMSLQRLEAREENHKIVIPFLENEEILTLQEIQNLLEKYNLVHEKSELVKGELSTYQREEDLFDIFKQKAKQIRDDSFSDYPELVQDFSDFQEVLKKLINRPLYKLQLLSAYHLAFAQNSCNFSVPGAGKTSIVYGAYAYLNSLPEDDPRFVDKLMIIGPIASFAPWEDEYEILFGKRPESQRLSGDSEVSKAVKQEHLYSSVPSELTLIFHGGVIHLQSEICDFLKKNKVMLVVDEAHRIKNPEGVWGKSIVDIAKEARSRVILTGTPTPNGYEDLYNLYQFLYPYKYKEILGFHYANLVDLTKNAYTDDTNVKSLIDNISPFFLRIRKKDLNLPPIKEQKLLVEMDETQSEIYNFIESKYIASFKDHGNATLKDTLNKAKLIRLRQAATNPSLLLKTIQETVETGHGGNPDFDFIKSLPNDYINDSEITAKIKNYQNSSVPNKFKKILEIIENEVVPENGKVIIWTIFIQNAKQLQTYLNDKGFKSELLIGEVEPKDRESIIKKFNNPDNSSFNVVIANPFSVSESISLHKGCHNAIYLERDYNCANFLQSKDRIHRVGLDPNQVTKYFYLVSEDSVDEIINDRLQIKIDRMEKIIDSDIPLFSRVNDSDETDIISELIKRYYAEGA